jgi:hypothetical protein
VESAEDQALFEVQLLEERLVVLTSVLVLSLIAFWFLLLVIVLPQLVDFIVC